MNETQQIDKVPTLMWRMSVLDRAMKQYGVDAQLDMLVEECAELIEAIQHMKRNRCGWNEVAEEMADVRVMINQFHTLDKVSNMIYIKEREKLERLEERLNEKNTMSDL